MLKAKQKASYKIHKITNILKASNMQKKILGFDIGLISYFDAYNLQLKLFELIKSNNKSGIILLLEHYPVITIGSNRNAGNLMTSKKKLKQKNIELVQSSHGGDITLHAPGQIVCYTILNLAHLKKDLSLFVYNLEQVIIDVLANYNIQGTRINKHRGIFVSNHKIASIGLKVRKWITIHGFSLNVNINLRYFDNIIACGLKNHSQTSMKQILNKTIPVYNVKEQILHSFGENFNIPVLKIT